MEYVYPENVRVSYCSFDDIKRKIASLFDFTIELSAPYKLCDYKPTYGHAFEKELKEYDFWGYCDIDLIFGDIRNFITDKILDKFDMIGFQGHSTIFRNSKEVNSRYMLACEKKYIFNKSKLLF